MGLQGFVGNESILYHLVSPCRVKRSASSSRSCATNGCRTAMRTATSDRRDRGGWRCGQRPQAAHVEQRRRDRALPADRDDGALLPKRRGRRGRLRRGSGTLETIFGDLPYREGDYIVIPRGTTYGSPRRRAAYVVFTSPGLIEIPRRYRNEYGQLLEHAPYYHRDIHPPLELKTHTDRGEFVVKVRIKDRYQTYVIDYHPFDVVGWDGYVYPWTFNINDFEPITGRIHMPPTHQTFQGHNFVICSFCPRKLDFDPLAIPIPYHHSNLNSEEMIYYVSGNFGSRKGIEIGSVTLHPSGIPRPHPGLAEKAIGLTERTSSPSCATRSTASALEPGARARRPELRVLVVRGAEGGRRGRLGRRRSGRSHLAPLRGHLGRRLRRHCHGNGCPRHDRRLLRRSRGVSGG